MDAEDIGLADDEELDLETGANSDVDEDADDVDDLDADDADADTEEEEVSDETEPDSESDEPEKPINDDDPAEAAKGLEKLAKSEFSWAAKRIQKQSEDIKKLRARETITLEPTADYPLAGIVTEEALKDTLATARETQKRLRALKDEDYTEDRDGQLVTEVLENGRRVLMTATEVADALAKAEARLDDNVVEAQRKVIAYRAQFQPREQAEALVPGILQPGTEANNVLESIQRQCPALLAALPDAELFIAHAYRSYRQEIDTLPTKEFPKGRKKIVIYDLDKDGKVVPPKRTAPPAGQKKAGGKPNPSLPRAPVPSRAPAKAVATTKREAAWGKARQGFVSLEDLVDDDDAG